MGSARSPISDQGKQGATRCDPRSRWNHAPQSLARGAPGPADLRPRRGGCYRGADGYCVANRAGAARPEGADSAGAGSRDSTEADAG